MEQFKQRLSSLIEDSPLTKLDIAKRLKIDNSALSRILSGERKLSSEELSELSDIFGVSTDYILGKTNTKNADEVKSVDLADDMVIKTFEGKPIPPEDLDILKRLLKGKD